MSKYSQKIFWITVSFLFAGFLWASIQQLFEKPLLGSSDDESSVASKGPKEGTIDTYDEKGVLKTRVNYERGYKHGISYLFYANGQVQLAIPYRYGDREGISRKYYESGKIYAETPYRNDKLTGNRMLFYRNGERKAVLPYFNSWPGLGLKEYYQSGEPKVLDTTIKYVINRNELKLNAPEECERAVAFFITDLYDDQFLDSRDPGVIQFASDGVAGYINLDVYTPSYLKMRDVVCHCKTKQGNEWVTKAEISF